MPRLIKGGKWVYGVSVVDDDRRIRIPQPAWIDYRFRAGDQAIFLRGSETSGGFAVGTPPRVAGLLASRMIGRSVFEAGCRVRVPDAVDVRPGQSLVLVRGSARALSIVVRGPLFEAALSYPCLPECWPGAGD
jgi:hypothetical protein